MSYPATKHASPFDRHSLRLSSLSLFLGCALLAIQAAPAQAPEPAPQQPAPTTAPALATEAQPAAEAAPTPQTPTPAAQPSPEPTPDTALPAPNPPAAVQPTPEEPGGITEEELRHLLVGKELYLRGGYLGDSLSFTEHGDPLNHPTPGSWTLSGVQIEKVHLTKHKVELEGARYGLHFLGALPNEDASKAVDRVKVTPKKIVLKITIDREQVIKPKKVKDPRLPKGAKAAAKDKNGKPVLEMGTKASVNEPDQPAQSGTAAAEPTPEEQAAQAKAELAATPEAERPSDPLSVTTTTSPAHATHVLHEALARIFSDGIDDQVRASMPQFWQLYFKAQAAGVDYRPADPSVLRSSAVDQQAKVLTSLAPDSNDYAQASAIAGRALYRAVIGADGRPSEIAVIRPIGFGLDENAVTAIGKATFQPATKAGQPVAETLDLAVLFRIYSKRTSGTAAENANKKETLPGPYTVQHPPTQTSPYQQP